MKKFLAVLTVLCMVLSIGTAAFAEVYVDGESQGLIQEVLVDKAQYVSADAKGDDLKVLENVTGDGSHNSVIAQNGAKITVKGAVTEKANGNAINASSGAVVEVGSVREDGAGNAVSASGSGTKVTVNNAVNEGAEGSAISAEKGAEVTVKGSVSETEGGDAISATEGATVTVEKYVKEDDAGHAVSATEGANVTVKGNVNEKDAGDAINASSGASVTVEGNVTESGDGNAIKATGAETMVTVEGNVKEEGNGSAINVSGATIIIVGNVEEANANDAITAAANATVIVGGNVSNGDETIATNAVASGFGATVIVEGLVTGSLNAYSQNTSGTIYLGELNGIINDKTDKNNIHYLVGLAENSAQNITDFNVTGTNNFSATSPVSGASGKEYFYTDSADPDILNNTSVTLTPRDSGKELTVSNLPAGVTSVSENGKLTLKFDSSFKGGLQNLLLILKDIAKQNPEVAAEIYVSAADYSNYVYVPEYSVTTTNAEVAVAAEELEEGAVKPFNLNNHTGVTLAPSVLGETEFYTIKVLKDSSELSAGNYSFQMHSDGSVSLILSNTYLLSLENGTYDFTVMVNGQKIIFTVVVNQ